MNVIVGAGGIVIASDSRRGMTSNGEEIGKMRGSKIVIVKDRFAIACLGYCTYRFAHTDRGENETLDASYDFSTWIGKIQSTLPDKCSFDDLVRTVKSEVDKLIPPLQPLLRSGRLQYNQDVASVFTLFTQYVIAGYQNGIPRLSVIEFYTDSDAMVMRGPYFVPLEPERRTFANHRIYFFGMQESAEDFDNRESYAYKQAMACCSKAFQDLIAKRSVTLNECAAFARALIKVEEQTNPNSVGGSVQVIGISPSGIAGEVAQSLPKTSPSKQNKTKH